MIFVLRKYSRIFFTPERAPIAKLYFFLHRFLTRAALFLMIKFLHTLFSIPGDVGSALFNVCLLAPPSDDVKSESTILQGLLHPMTSQKLIHL